MIFQITCEEGEPHLSIFSDRYEWLDYERAEIKDTDLEQDSSLYLGQFLSKKAINDLCGGSLELAEIEGKIIIEGEIIIPKVKSTVNVIDL